MPQQENCVWVHKTSPLTLRKDMRKVLETADFRRLDPGSETLIKLNANFDRFWPGCNTSPWFLDALLGALREAGFERIRAIEGDLKFQPASSTISAIGFDRILAKHRVPFLPLEKVPRSGELPCILDNSQLISTPVLHTHTFAVISVASKNLYGLLPVYRECYHSTLTEKLLELATRIGVFSIVDGTVGLEGGSMRMGMPVRTNVLISGWNPLAIDSVSAKIMGIDEDDVPLLDSARKNGLLPLALVMGDYNDDNLPRFTFHYSIPALARIDLWLRRNAVTKSLFGYNSRFDKAANIYRRKYTKWVCDRKTEMVSRGDWCEYLRYWSQDNENPNNPGY